MSGASGVLLVDLADGAGAADRVGRVAPSAPLRPQLREGTPDPMTAVDTVSASVVQLPCSGCGRHYRMVVRRANGQLIPRALWESYREGLIDAEDLAVLGHLGTGAA